ncbi:phage tail protein [Pararhodospirillum photometricum]|uniref:Putative bacteriophage tail completion protein R n=1 Tax=Pararhodospirillum photometricum DSM 122 TaxID=1150469 RepID=H6SQI5_PARPM|nr:phage tail protein [Pararhodospirillum photometricum]CCG09704.1 Putative bacteriophage tail completion protein R [Pararhodospirillum photometricum DSM 122]
MRKVTQLRDALLTAPLGLTADKVLTFVEAGKVISCRGHQNEHIRLSYTIRIVVLDYVGVPHDLLWLVARWYHEAEPAALPEAVTFKADILDHRSADMLIEAPVTETVRATPTADGTTLESEGDPDALAIDMSHLVAGLP